MRRGKHLLVIFSSLFNSLSLISKNVRKGISHPLSSLSPSSTPSHTSFACTHAGGRNLISLSPRPLACVGKRTKRKLSVFPLSFSYPNCFLARTGEVFLDILLSATDYISCGGEKRSISSTFHFQEYTKESLCPLHVSGRTRERGSSLPLPPFSRTLSCSSSPSCACFSLSLPFSMEWVH